MSPQELDARIVNKWVLIHNTGKMFNHDKERYGVSVDFCIGYVYVDQQAGLTIDILSYCEVDDKSITLTKGPHDENTSMKVRFSHANNTNLTCKVLTDEQLKSLSLPTEPDWLQFYKVKGQEELDRIRQINLLHPLRAPRFPDDIRFILASNNPSIQPEQVWGRIIANPQESIFIIRLLNQPNQDIDGIKINDVLAVQVKEIPNGISAMYVGKVDLQ